MPPLLIVALVSGSLGADAGFAVRLRAAQEAVGRLGHAQFRARETAARDLIRLGEAALGPLTAGERDPDPERSTRCRQVRGRVEEGLVSGKLARLVSRPAAHPPAGLPGLTEFLGVTGDRPQARELYAEMVGRCRPCLEALAARPNTLADSLREYCAGIDSRLSRPRPTAADEHELRLRPAELAAVLFFASRPLGDRVGTEIDSAVNRVSYSKEATDLLAAAGTGAPERRLLVGAIRRHPGFAVGQGLLWLAARAKVTEAVPVLAEALRDVRVNDFGRGDFLTCLGAIGTRETAAEVRRIKTLFDGTTEINCVQFGDQSGLPLMRVQLRDVAVGVCAELEGRDLDRLGFHPEARKAGAGYPTTMRYALIDDASRAEVHRRWRELSDKPTR